MKCLAQRSRIQRRRQRGFTLVELMVTVAIALFLLGGLAMIVQNTRTAFADQNRLSQLQDGQRLATIMMTDVIQNAGYFSNPVANNAGVLTAVAPFTTAGQALFGTHPNGAAAPGDTLMVRFYTESLDPVLNCHGTSNTSGAAVLYTNTFSVVAGQLTCDPGDGTGPLPLVNGVQNLQVVYGVKRNFAVAGNDVDTYLTADQMTNADWINLTSVTITLTFVNPLACAGPCLQGQSANQPAVINFTRVVDVMNRTGET